MNSRLDDLRIKIFADGADLADFDHLAGDPQVAGVTTNPTLMRRAGITDYVGFARELLKLVPDIPVSFEVFADEFDDIEEQARLIAGWGENVFVKIPITNTRGESCVDVLGSLAADGVRVNVTALMTLDQVAAAADALGPAPEAFISVFAGRIADTGRDPMPIMRKAVEILAETPQVELIWASPREVLNVFQADEVGCHVITVTPDLLAKLAIVGKDLEEFSLETVEMFYDDACAAGYSLGQSVGVD
jgi:transaldolase